MGCDPEKLREWAQRMKRHTDKDVASFAEEVEYYIECIEGPKVVANPGGTA